MINNKARWLVSICSGRWQTHGIQCAMKAGLNVLALDGDSTAPGLKIAQIGRVVDIRDLEAVVKVIESEKIKPSGVISFASEAGMLTTAGLRERFGLPGPNVEGTLALTNKAKQRSLWKQAGLPGPEWKVVKTFGEFEKALTQIGFPCVIKPVDSAGSRGVCKLEKGMDWRAAGKEAFNSTKLGQIIVESYMHGNEFTVESFSVKGKTHVLAVTEKFKVPGTGGTVAMELSSPDLSDAIVSKIATTAVDSLAALGYTDGPGHTEVILRSSNNPGLVEAAGRGGGFMVFDKLIPMVSGFDIATACALQAVGLDISPLKNLSNNSVALRFFPSKPGMVKRISGFDKANKILGVTAGPFVEVGEKVGEVKGDGDRMGFILAAGQGPKEARSKADQAEKLISFEVEAAIESACD